MKKIILSFMLAFSATIAVIAQEHAIFTQYTQFPVLVNPGYTGFDDDHQLLLKMRSNWAGFPGAPKSYLAQYNGAVTDKLGLGAGLFTESIGSQTFNKINLNYAFRFKMKSTKIGIGLSTDFINTSLESSLLVNPLVDGSDQALENAVTGQRIFAATAGIYGTYADRFMFGLSFPSAIRTRLDAAPIVGGEEEENGGLGKYYILQLGYTLDVPGQNFKLVPSMSLRKIREVPYQIDFNLRGLFFEDKLVAGVTYRAQDKGVMSFQIGGRLKQLQFHYSYDISFQEFQTYNTGGHEFGVGYTFKKKAKQGTELK